MLKVLITVLNEVPDYTTTFGYGKKGVYKCRCFTLMDLRRTKHIHKYFHINS